MSGVGSAPDAATAVGAGGRSVKHPYLYRADVASICFVTAHWGAGFSDESNKRLKDHVLADFSPP